jgi:hypothetical protein
MPRILLQPIIIHFNIRENVGIQGGVITMFFDDALKFFFGWKAPLFARFL